MQQPWMVISATRDAGLDEVLACAQRITSLDRVLVVASSHTVARVRAQLVWYPDVQLVVEPRDLGSAVELLFPLASVLESDPLAVIVFVPAECHVAGHVLADALESASYTIAGHQLALVGPGPFDWRSGRASFIAAGLLTTFWDQARLALPEHAAMFERYAAAIATPDQARALDAAFTTLLRASVGRDLLAHAHQLAIVPLSPHRLHLHVLTVDAPAAATAPSREAA